MTCPHCKQDFDIEEKNSGYQVNDLTEGTYCSVDCSAEHLFTEEAIPSILEHLDCTTSKEEIIEKISNEVGSYSDKQIDDLATKLIAQLKLSAEATS